MADGITATQAVAHFLNSLEPERARDDRDEVERFADWFGRDRELGELKGDDVAAYVAAERGRVGDDLGHLEPLRALLAYSARLSFLDDDLVEHLPFPRVTPRASGDPEGMGENAYFVTIEGLAALERELEELKAQRPLIADQLRAAMADKDFRENAPLDAARDAQAHLEARIRQIEDQLRHAVIIDVDSKAGRANVGSTIRVLNLKVGKEQVFHLVSPNEVDPTNGKISIESPVGRAVINRGAGEEVTVVAPAGELQLRLLEVIG